MSYICIYNYYLGQCVSLKKGVGKASGVFSCKVLFKELGYPFFSFFLTLCTDQTKSQHPSLTPP